MSEPFLPIASAETEYRPPSPRGHPWLAWLFIAALAALFIYRQMARTEAADGGQDQELSRIVTELQLRYLVGATDALPVNAQELYEQAQAFNTGTVGQRLRFIIVAGELAGPGEALDLLKALEDAVAEHERVLTPEEERVVEILKRLYTDYRLGAMDAPSVSAEEKQLLREQLGWLGELALHPRPAAAGAAIAAPAGAAPAAALAIAAAPPAGREEVLAPARRTFAVLIGAVGGILLLAGIGLFALIAFLALLAARRLEGGITTGVTSGGIYAETFAAWIALFLGLLALLGSIETLPMLPGAGLAMALSLLALVWPVLRGIPWAQVRQDIGWTLGRQPLLEPAAGLLCYVMAMPLLAVGLGITIVLLIVQRALAATGDGDPFAPTSAPAHPVVEQLASGDPNVWLQVFVLAAIVAPIVEETMFRGVLYRHLREASARWGWLWSVIASGTVASFIFAVVHPQGVVAVPLLMALAYGFTIAREWRGTLIPAIVGHALNNAMVTTLAVYALS